MKTSPERWSELGEWLDRLLEVEPADRPAVAARLAGEDEEARRELLELARAYERHGEALDRPLEVVLGGVSEGAVGPGAVGKGSPDRARSPGGPGGGGEGERPDPWIGRQVGDYRLIRRIGVGGMGAVYTAERADRRFERTVAVKLVRGGPDQQQIRRRFRRERRILAGLEHPNVARLLDAGVTGDGVPYFVMENVEGVPIDRFCAGEGLSVEGRVELFLQVCEAVRYAHQRLVVHRDIKPGNILVTPEGRAKLLDFGVAKLLGDEGKGDDLTLASAGRPLTPSYASPEQLRGEPVSTASDVYSLGVVLYELLTGRRPVEVDGSPLSIARSLETIPEAPSEAVSEEAWGERSEDARRELSGDLDHILLMALRKEPERRYDSADRLAEDLRRWLGHKPVRARPDTLGYRGRKFVRRNRAAVVAAAAVVLSLLAGITARTVEARRATRAAERAEAERANAEAASTYLERMIWTASPGWATPGDRVGPHLTIADLLESIESSVGEELADRPTIEARIRRMLGIAFFYMARYEDAARQAERAYRLDRAAYGEFHYDVAHDLEILADAESARGSFDAALGRYRRAIRIFRRVVTGPDTDLFFIATLNNHGKTLQALGRYEEAETLLLEARDRSRSDLGPNHPMEAIVISNRALVSAGRGELDRAADQVREALRIWRGVPGRERFEQGAAMASLARIEVLRGRLEAADSLLASAREVLGRTPETYHSFAYGVWTALARLHEVRGELDRAEAAARRALGVLEGKVGSEHPDVAGAETILGRVLVAAGRPGEAEPLLRHAVAVYERLLPEGTWILAEARAALGEALRAMGQREEAEALLRDAPNDPG